MKSDRMLKTCLLSLIKFSIDYIQFVREKQEDNTTINNHTPSSLSERFVLNISEFHSFMYAAISDKIYQSENRE